jgi:2-aminoadipate transaminase
VWLIHKNKKTAYANLKSAFGSTKSAKELRTIVLRSYQNIAMAVIDLFRIPLLTRQKAFEVQSEGEEHLRRALARGKGVIYLSTFSKSLSPGIRLGYVLADGPIIQQLVFAKQAADLQTNSFIQHVVYHYCRMGFFEKHIPTIIKDYAHRANVMLSAIHEHFPSDVKIVEPEGGMFIWCTLPKGIKSADVFKKAIQQNVAFVDGSAFYANGGGENTMRLNFTNSSDDAIRSGIKRLGGVIRSFL